MSFADEDLKEPLAVSPKKAMFLLDIGHSRLYELMAAGELESYNEGRLRKITMLSINARVARLLNQKVAA